MACAMNSEGLTWHNVPVESKSRDREEENQIQSCRCLFSVTDCRVYLSFALLLYSVVPCVDLLLPCVDLPLLLSADYMCLVFFMQKRYVFSVFYACVKVDTSLFPTSKGVKPEFFVN